MMSASTSTSRPISRQQPIGEAVSNAFQDANAANTMSAELLEQITQNVIRKLQDTGLENLTPSASHQTAAFSQNHPASHSAPHPPPLSPSTSNLGASSPTLPTRVFTPPSPQKQTDYIGPVSPSLSAGYGTDVATSPHRGRSQATLSPNRPSSPSSQGSAGSDGAHAEGKARPKGPPRLHTGVEETTLEKIWGPLFDEQGKATLRLSQFLRGLAVHIIDDFEPRHSLVVTPEKMIRYYKDVALKTEMYPWAVIFDDERSSISRMYRELSCQHHLIQEHFDERPDIPGLTPGGFEKWVTLLIRANPDSEYERLTKALLHMPIDNPDNKKERFPKEITRRLFPTYADLDVRYRVEDAMIEHASIEIPRPHHPGPDDTRTRHDSPASKAQAEQKQPPRPSVSFAEPEIIQETPPSQPPPSTQHERPPHAYVSEVDEDVTVPEPPVSKPIERERKPYVAQVGGGRQYEPEEIRPRESGSRQRGNSVISGGADYRTSRSDSTSAHSRPIPANPNMQQMPKPEIHQSHYDGGAASNPYRRRSPSFSQGSDTRRPDPDLLGGYRPTFETGSLPRGTANAPPVFDETDTKRYFDNQARDRVRRKADEDARAYADSPRRHSSLKPKRADYTTEDEYWRARDKRDRSYDDENRYRDTHGGYR